MTPQSLHQVAAPPRPTASQRPPADVRAGCFTNARGRFTKLRRHPPIPRTHDHPLPSYPAPARTIICSPASATAAPPRRRRLNQSIPYAACWRRHALLETSTTPPMHSSWSTTEHPRRALESDRVNDRTDLVIIPALVPMNPGRRKHSDGGLLRALPPQPASAPYIGPTSTGQRGRDHDHEFLRRQGSWPGAPVPAALHQERLTTVISPSMVATTIASCPSTHTVHRIIHTQGIRFGVRRRPGPEG